MTFSEKVFSTGIVPVVVLNNVEDAEPLAKALLKGGIDFMEITFRTECAADSIAVIAKEVPEMTVGAGTVINVEQAALAVKNGAKFIVSPGLDEGVDQVHRVVDHQVHVEEQAALLAQRGDDGRPERKVGHERAVHVVDMDPGNARSAERREIIRKIAVIR